MCSASRLSTLSSVEFGLCRAGGGGQWAHFILQIPASGPVGLEDEVVDHLALITSSVSCTNGALQIGFSLLVSSHVFPTHAKAVF